MDVLRHPPSSRVDFELLKPVLQQHLSVFKFLQSSSLGECFESPHVEPCQFLKDWVPLWVDMVHDHPQDEGGELDDSSLFLASFTDGLDHVDDIFNPSVAMVSIASSMSNLRSLSRPARVSVISIILATICGA